MADDNIQKFKDQAWNLSWSRMGATVDIAAEDGDTAKKSAQIDKFAALLASLGIKSEITKDDGLYLITIDAAALKPLLLKIDSKDFPPIKPPFWIQEANWMADPEDYRFTKAIFRTSEDRERAKNELGAKDLNWSYFILPSGANGFGLSAMKHHFERAFPSIKFVPYSVEIEPVRDAAPSPGSASGRREAYHSYAAKPAPANPGVTAYRAAPSDSAIAAAQRGFENVYGIDWSPQFDEPEKVGAVVGGKDARQIAERAERIVAELRTIQNPPFKIEVDKVPPGKPHYPERIRIKVSPRDLFEGHFLGLETLSPQERRQRDGNKGGGHGSHGRGGRPRGGGHGGRH